MFTWRRRDDRTAASDPDEESVDVVARLHPYEELFDEAMAMAARFAQERERRDRAAAARPPVRLFGRRAG